MFISIMWAVVVLLVGLSGVRAIATHNRRKLELRASQQLAEQNRRQLEAASAEHDREVARLERKNKAMLEELNLPEIAKVKKLELERKAIALELEIQKAGDQAEQEHRTAVAVDEATMQQRVDAELAVIAAQKAARVKHSEELVLAEITVANRRPDMEVLAEGYSRYVELQLDAHKHYIKNLAPGSNMPKFVVKNFEEWAGKLFTGGGKNSK